MEQGRILKVQGHRIVSQGPRCRIGDLVLVRTSDGRFVKCLTEGFDGIHVHLLALEDTHGLVCGAPLYTTGRPVSIEAGPWLKGRILNGFGQRPEGEAADSRTAVCPTMIPRPHRLLPLPLTRKFHTGVRSIDVFLTMGSGQRAVLQSYSPCPSTMRKTLSMIARHGRAQTVVLGLVGYQQRCVREMMTLLRAGPCHHAVVFSAPSEASAGERFHCPYAATTAAEYFRDQGEDVLLILDSMQEWQKAYCELSILPTDQARNLFQGATLAQVVERAGRRARGSITALFGLHGPDDSLSLQLTELVESRVVFTRKMEYLGVYPPIDILRSDPYMWTDNVALEEQVMISRFRSVLQYYERNRQLIQLGAIFEGLSERTDQALDRIQRCFHFLRQGLNEASNERDSLRRLNECVS